MFLSLGYTPYRRARILRPLTTFRRYCKCFVSFSCKAVTYGLGRHSVSLTLDQIVSSNKWEIIGQTFVIMEFAVSKAAVAFFVLRLVTARWHRSLLYYLIASTYIVMMLTAILDFAQCSPVAHVWNPTIEASCWTSQYTKFALFAGCKESSSFTAHIFLE